MNLLPDKDLITAACRGMPTLTTNPMLDAAAELAVLHQTRECTPWSRLREIDAQRAQLMHTVDLWVTLATPIPFPAARINSQTVGQVVDQLAELTMQAFAALADAPDPVLYDAQVRLDEMAAAYQDLMDELAAGTRRVPSVAAVLKPP
ncbi:hypothetical protein OHB12_04905 [Nocardia sp. NBC_01730]|uniref:DUF4254 domain-containing protein n=1 Tax=Nocardia sp. NBC_01730 TaxID=2975998 RepID=UPI002E0D4CCA|nr:hypothetical protein OHB12_04905 [Nocardia sp. NBC_01730]